MKIIKISKQILFLMLITLGSCAVLPKYELNTYTFDFAKFEKQGVLVTTGDMFQKYKSICLLTVDCYNGYIPRVSKTEKVKNKTNNSADDAYSNSSPSVESNKNYEYKTCTYDDLLIEMVNQAKDKGANAIIKLEFKPVKKYYSDKNYVMGIEIEGLAIKIE